MMEHDEGEAFITISETNRERGTEFEKGIEDSKIYEMQIETNVRNRFAHTIVTSKIRNLKSSPKEVTFSVILPENAFISEFVMIIGGKSYKAHVKEKEEAQHIYDEAVQKGVAAAQVAVSARESNHFGVSVNVEPLSTATFLLTYEELLKRKENMYELIINIHPKQAVENLLVNVLIDESRALKFVKAPALRSGNEITEKEGDLNPKAEINQFSPTSAVIRFKPSVERQKEIATILGTNPEEGFAGQFIVQYDVARDPAGGEVLIQDGYFIHFFAPDDIKPLNKLIIFVLDTSGSMSSGEKMVQLKQAMNIILSQLTEDDYFHIVCFQSHVEVWDIQNPKNTIATRSPWEDQIEEKQTHEILSDYNYPPVSSANLDNISKAKEILAELEAFGGTNIYEALQIALILIKKERNRGIYENRLQPMIMFLTDGEPTESITDTNMIISDITKSNEEKASIFTLSFGITADKTFLKKLAQKNHAFSRHIYEASDAALQLHNFYKEIASPLLSDVHFEYMPDTISLTKTVFPLHFDGGEIVVSGRLSGAETFTEVPTVKCCGRNGQILLQSVLQRPVTSLERLWAYLTVQQLLEECEIALDKTIIEQKALNLALQYSFVTPLTSLVVVRPDTNDFSETAMRRADSESISLDCGSKRIIQKRCMKKRVIKKRKAKKEYDEVPEEIISNQKIPATMSKIQKCRFFLWAVVGRLLSAGAIFRVSCFVSLFFYFLIMFEK